MPQLYSIHRGDNLTSIARRFNTTPEAIAEANGLRDVDDIVAGRTLTIPNAWGSGTVRSTTVARDGFEERQAPAVALTVESTGGRGIRASPDGTPMFRQGDPEWGARVMRKVTSLSRSGCAVTVTAMAMSKISGRTITPGELDQYLDTHGGYTRTNAMDWSVAVRAQGLTTERARWSLDRINEELDAGRPVAVGVDYKPGSEGGANGTDHWVAVTRRERNEQGSSTYFANDPATGTVITLSLSHGRLIGPGGYKSTGQLQVFGQNG